MKKVLLLIILLTAWVAFQKLSSPRKEIRPPVNRPAIPSTQLRPSPPQEKRLQKTVSTSRPFHAKKRQAQKPQPKSPSHPLQDVFSRPSHLVYFEVRDNKAIAFGDVLLGAIDDKNLENGFYEPAQPKLWNNHEIAYTIDPNLPNPERVQEAIRYFNENTPIAFVPYNGQPNAIAFEKGEDHCYSYLGMVGGMQPISLSDQCGPGEVMHEIMHALGFIHEHSRTNRDDFVKVLWENIETRYQSQFAIAPEKWMEALRGTPFDFQSIMIYRPDSFAKNPGLTTLEARGGEVISPQKLRLSDGDIDRLVYLYGKN